MSAIRLSRGSLDRLGGHVQPAGTRPQAPTHGIVHLGIGAFHRAHQAICTDDANGASQDQWGITGVSLQSGRVASQLNPQDGLYTVSLRSAAGTSRRLVGAVHQVLVARDAPQAVVDAIASPATRIVSLTVTEKGYCRDARGHLDHSLAGDGSLYRFLRDGLAKRMHARLPGITVLSCDNLAGNGAQLERLLREYLLRHQPPLAQWVQDNCSCPATMVDRIVPASRDEDLEQLQQAIGLRDEGAVFTEPFFQWVLEDRFVAGRPHWESGGAQFTSHVEPWETAKLRMLNGAHSALAYLGLARGHEFVHQAVADGPLRALVERLMREEAAPTISPAPGQDLDDYATRLLERFANPALRHRLQQISMDGSQKIPQRWLQTLASHQRQGRACPALLTALAAWVRFVRGDRWTVDDPQAGELARLWRENDDAGLLDALFSQQGMFGREWTAGSADRAELLTRLRQPAGLL